MITAHAKIDIEDKIEKMSIEEKVGQLFLFGFRGKRLTPRLKRTIQKLKPGALIIFGRNISSIEQLSKLNYDLQEASLKKDGLPLFLAVDQEGGDVIRIKTTPPMPSAYTIGKTQDPKLAYRAGEVTGDMLKVLGFNMNLAPVLDMTDENLRSFISTRSFSPYPNEVSSMGIAFAKGLSRSKIVPVAKHFPGHGPIAMDSHHLTPTRQSRVTDLYGMDLIPFIRFAKEDLDSGTMVAHISFPQIDSSGQPATYSPVLIDDLLRRRMKYKGLIMTDDIEMAGASSYKKVGDRAVAAVNAGHDLVMVGWNTRSQKRAVKAVIKSVKKGEIPIQRINASVRRILRMKNKYVDILNTNPQRKKVRREFLSINYKPVFDDIIRSHFEDIKSLPAVDNSNPIIVVSRSKQFRRTFRKHYPKKKSLMRYSFDKKTRRKQKGPVVFHVSSWSSFRELQSLSRKIRARIVVINSHRKFRIPKQKSYLKVIEVHSDHPKLGAFTAQTIKRAWPRSVASH